MQQHARMRHRLSLAAGEGENAKLSEEDGEVGADGCVRHENLQAVGPPAGVSGTAADQMVLVVAAVAARRAPPTLTVCSSRRYARFSRTTSSRGLGGE